MIFLNNYTIELPFIYIPELNAKFLLDTGSTKSFIKPELAYYFYPNFIEEEIFQVQTAHATSFHNEVANIPIFPIFNINETHKFYLFNFSEKFDGLIGLDLIMQLNANLDFSTQTLQSPLVTIPICYQGNMQVNQNNSKPKLHFTYIIEPRCVQKIEIPVNLKEGIGIISYQTLDEIEIPECLVSVKNYLANTTVLNPCENPIKLDLFEPINIQKINTEENYFIDENISFSDQPVYIDKNTDNKLKANLKKLRLEHCNRDEKDKIRKLCFEYRDIFHCEEIPLTFTNAIKHSIKLTDDSPIYTKSYRYPEVYKKEVKDQISKLLKQNIIRDSNSPFSSPIWVVPKKPDASGKQKFRLTIDYRRINEKSLSDKFPLPNINEILDKLGKAQYFTTLDLANGFYQIEMNEEDIHKTAFTTDLGHYEFLRMPFGLKNAPATFQRVMNNILRGLQDEICFVYLDDIIIFSTSLQEHIEKLKKVFERLRQAKFKIQLDKSEFLRKEVQYLGHIVTKDGIKPNPEKIRAVKSFPIPKTQKEIKSFLGLIGYYRRFIKDFAKITKPMTKCLKKDAKIQHTTEYVNAFEHCKNLLINAPILQYPDFSKPFILSTDASNFALGAILSQGTVPTDKPIAYASRTLNETETRYSTIEKELLAIVWASKYFRPYLYGRHFYIYTDHRPLVWLFNLKDANSKLMRWKIKLEEFDYTIIYKKGTQNSNVDALSRIQLNIYENESIMNNPGDSDNDIISYLRNLAENPIDNENNENNEVSENNTSIHNENNESANQTRPGNLQSSSKINILSDIRIIPHGQTSTDVTVHSNQKEIENNGISILDEIINNKSLQYLIKKWPHQKTKINFEIFEKKNINHVELPDNPEIIKQFIRDYMSPDKTCYVYFYNKDFIQSFTNIYTNNFKKPKIIRCTKLVNNIENQDEKLLLIKHQHESKTNHRGITETYDRLKQNYYWSNMKDDVTKSINDCVACQTLKYSRQKSYIPLVKTETPTKPFEILHMDTFIFEAQSFLTIFDKFSKYGQAYACDKNAKSICDKLINFFSFFGCPETIVSDNGPEFNNELVKELLKAQKINIHFTTPGHHESNSPVERFHSTIIEHLRLLSQKDVKKSVSELMPYAIIAYNNTVHSTTKYTPQELILGHTNTRDPFDLIPTTFYSDYVASHNDKVQAIYNKVTENTELKKEKMLVKTNPKGDIPYQFKINQKVYKKSSARSKSKAKFLGPYIIKEILEHNRVKIANFKNQNKTEIIHVKELKQPLVTDVLEPISEEIPQNITT